MSTMTLTTATIGSSLKKGFKVRHALVLAKRNVVKMVRTPEQFIDVTLQPVIFLALFTYIFGGALAGGSQHAYLEFLLPGMLGQTIAMSSVAIGQNMNADIAKGVFDRFRSLPIGRAVPLIGAVLADLIRYAIVCVVTLAFGYLIGFRIATDPLKLLAALGLAVLFALSFAWVSVFVGMTVRTAGAVQGIMFLLIFPLSFGSNTFVRPATMPGWLQAFVAVNPLSHLVSAVRGLMLGGPVGSQVGWTLVWCVGLLVVFFPLALRAYIRRALFLGPLPVARGWHLLLLISGAFLGVTMRRNGATAAIFLAVAAITGLTGLTGAVASAAPSASPASGTWSKALKVPGLDNLSPGVNETVAGISCTGPGDCTTGGADDSNDPTHAFSLNQAWVASEAGGKWASAEAVPGTAALNTSSDAATTAVSCSWPGNCVAAGYAAYQYSATAAGTAGFVINQVNGKWGTARPVPALPAAVHSAEVTAVSCAPATTAAARKAGLNCVAVGVSQLAGGTSTGFVLAEVNGTWRTAQRVPGLLSAHPGSAVTSVSCPAPGTCGIGGYYHDGSGHRQAFVASEAGGTWHSAQQVPGSGALNAGGNASVTSVSCPAVGSCVAAGTYRPKAGPGQLFVVNEGAGQWKRAIQLPGSGPLIAGNGSAIGQVSCATATVCEVGGTLTVKAATRGFLAGETSGRWNTMYVVPGERASTIAALSCPASGYCAAGGQLSNNSGGSFAATAVVLDEAAGHWGKTVPLYSGYDIYEYTDSVYGISCVAPRDCGAAGEGTGWDEGLPFAFASNEKPVQ